MINDLRRRANVYSAFILMVPKLYLAYNTWVVMEFVVQIFMMVIFVAFWRAVYANAASLGGLSLEQMISYILLAQIVAPLVQSRLILDFGGMLRQGAVAIELLRPVDYQARSLVETMTSLLVFAIQKVPLLLIAWGFLGLRLPSDTRAWVAFTISLILGQVVLFFADWIFACLAFYSTETWGLSVVKTAVATFFSGALIPLAMLPDWLRTVAMALPFAQGLAIPVSFLSGVTPPSQILPLAATQVAWILGLGIASRLVFRHAVRRVTVQGG